MDTPTEQVTAAARAAFAAGQQELAAWDASHQQELAYRFRQQLQDFLTSAPVTTFEEKSDLVCRINGALQVFRLTLAHEGSPCCLSVRRDEGKPQGEILITPENADMPVVQTVREADLLRLEVRSAAGKEVWRTREFLWCQSAVADPYAPLLSESAGRTGVLQT